MPLHLPTMLVVSVAMMAASSAMMTIFGRTQRVYPGFWWWTAAQWMGTLGLLLQVLRDAAPQMLPLSNLLLMQWPIVTLAGVRRFYPRHEIRTPPLIDVLVFATAYAVWLAFWAAGGDLRIRVAVFAIGACVLQLYSAAVTASTRDFRSSTGLKSLVAALCIGAVVQVGRVVQVAPTESNSLAGDAYRLVAVLLTVIMGLVMTYVVMLLTHERTERQLHESQRQLRFLADTDALTEVANRRHFYEQATKAMALSAPGRAAIVMFDVDDFKQINDRFGHAEGDEVLREVGRCTRETLRARDVAGRVGGDEFAMLLPETTTAEAMAVANRVAVRLDASPGRPAGMQLSLSFGVVIAREGENIADAMRRADRALYEAKRQGRSRAVAAAAAEDDAEFGESRPVGLGTR